MFFIHSATYRTKFDSRADPHVFLGYPPGQKGYKVLNLLSLQISISRNVIFYEQHFSFYISNPTSKHLFFLPIVTKHSSFVDIVLPDIFTHISHTTLEDSTSDFNYIDTSSTSNTLDLSNI